MRLKHLWPFLAGNIRGDNLVSSNGTPGATSEPPLRATFVFIEKAH